jgi:hypothetical protein
MKHYFRPMIKVKPCASSVILQSSVTHISVQRTYVDPTDNQLSKEFTLFGRESDEEDTKGVWSD